MKSGKEKNRRIFFVNRSKIVKGDSDVKKDVRSSWEMWAEKFVKSRFRDREKSGNLMSFMILGNEIGRFGKR